MTDHRAEADRQMAERTTYGVPSAEANRLAAIHDLLDARLPKPDPEAYERAAAEYQSLRETQERASKQQAEALTLAQQFMEAIKGEPCPCGCRRDVEPKPTGVTEPESVTVTLLNPPGMPETWRSYADHADKQGCLHEVGDMLRNVADALDAASATQEAAEGGRVAQGAGDAERRCGACRDLSDTHVGGCDGTWGQ